MGSGASLVMLVAMLKTISPALVAALSLILTAGGMGMGFGGIQTLPKCRFGENECYFKVTVCDTGGACKAEMKHRAIEGSTSDPDGVGMGEPVVGAEALAIPALAVAMTAVPAMSTAIGLCFRSVGTSVDILSLTKVLVGVSLSLLFVGVRIIQDLTFDCRWWNNNLHGNSEICHHGLNLYVAALCLFAISQLASLVVATHAVEETYDGYSAAPGSDSTTVSAPVRTRVENV